MIRRLFLGVATALLFAIVATANSGGYRYGVSDQSFYLPALAKSLDPSLYPRDTPMLEGQMRFWLADNLLAAAAGGAGVNLPNLAGVLYATGLLLLAAALAYFARGLGASWLAVGVGLAAATLRHHITNTGANTLEGYCHPRMIAYALGLWALGCVLRRRYGVAIVLVAAAAVVHPTSAMWFGAAVVSAAAWSADRRTIWGVIAAVALVCVSLASMGTRMDAPWLAVVAEKDYLFPSAWPVHAWVINLAYPVVLLVLYRRRVNLARTAPGEGSLVAGLLVLVGGFLASVPLSAARIALAVQFQINRVFWVLDGVVLLYLAWWLIDDVGTRRGGRWRTVAAVLMLALSLGRGFYVLVIEAGRPLVSWTLPKDEWTDAMNWLRTQPATLNVLADPGHAWRYGSSVRVAALRDTVLEQMKDTAMAMYDRTVARRVGERMEALAGFADFSPDQIRAVGARFQADVVILERTRRLDLPVLFENSRFVVYDLRH